MLKCNIALVKSLLCCPSFEPQMTGVAPPLVFVMTANVSRQPPTLSMIAAVARAILPA